MTDREGRIRKLPEALLPWFASCGRSMPWRDDPTPYHVWLSEIMLQQTRIETVKPYYIRFLREIPDIPSLAAADPEHLHKLWEGLGYYSRVRNLQKAARQIMEQYGGRFPEKYADIRSLCGIGDYTAGAIASICYELPCPAVDGNVLRVLSRITGDERPVTDEKTRSAVRTELSGIYPEKHCGAFTQSVMELGETICLPSGAPDCENCPCRLFCVSSGGAWVNFPAKVKKKPRRQEQMTVFLLRCGDHTAVRKRPEKGLLAGLWEFPNVPGHLSAEEAMHRAEKWGCCPITATEKPSRTHIFTHVEWDMKCWAVECRKIPDVFFPADECAFLETVALPTAFRKFL